MVNLTSAVDNKRHRKNYQLDLKINQVVHTNQLLKQIVFDSEIIQLNHTLIHETSHRFGKILLRIYLMNYHDTLLNQ